MQRIHLKKNLFLLLTGLCAGLLSVSEIHAQTAIAYSNEDSLSVGELFEVSIKARYDQQYNRIVFPDSSIFPDAIEFLGTRQYRVTDFSDSLVYSLQFFAGQNVTLPPFRIGFIGTGDTTFIFTNQLTLAFKSVLPSEEAELKPLKDIFSFGGFPWAWFVIISALIAAAIWAYFTFNKTPEEEPEFVTTFIPYVSPVEELESTLKSLREEYDLAATKDYKYFYSTLSDSIRNYFEELYQIPALESTTRELLRYLDAFGADHEMIKSTRTILNRSDMVKFAKFTPTLDDAWSVYQEAINFLDRARLVDASRISRKKSEYEASLEPVVSNTPDDEDLKENA